MLTTPITVLGAGSFGTALAILLARNGNAVRLWGHDAEQIHLIENNRENKRYLPNIKLPDRLKLFTDLTESLQGVVEVIIAVPSHGFRDVLQQLHRINSSDLNIAWGTKGLDPKTKQLCHQVVAEIFSKQIPMAALSGPSFAREIAENRPTAVSLAGKDTEFLQNLVTRLHNEYFRVYINSDLSGVELCGALKNVLAIAVGVVDGLALGANTRCALITRGLAEMQRLCLALGGEEKTVMSLAGVGDLILTCTDNQSRNRRLGLAIGQGESIAKAKADIGQVVEGLDNTQQIYQLAQELQVEMPIVTQVYQVLFANRTPKQVIKELLTRSPKQE